MIAVMIVPTGIGAEIGGHAGDATPAAKLLASVCDTLILHPNVVNASDINEMPENSLYVDGFMLDEFLKGRIRLQRVRQNKVLVVTNAPLRNDTVNAVSAARATLGLDAAILVLKTPLRMTARIENGCATGDVSGWEQLLGQVAEYDFDALAITTPIDVPESVAKHYLDHGGINPWGGVEAIASRLIAEQVRKPVAHAPQEDPALKDYRPVTDPRMAAEMVSTCYLHCVLKGLQRAPRAVRQGERSLGIEDVDCLITPTGCYGPPHAACLFRGIPVMAVRENQTAVRVSAAGSMPCTTVDNYLEAAGLLACMKCGITPASVRRPLAATNVWHDVKGMKALIHGVDYLEQRKRRHLRRSLEADGG